MKFVVLLAVPLLLGVHPIPLRAADPSEPNVNILPGTPETADLIGEWFRSKMSTVEFSNPNTGSFSDPSGERTSVRFLPNGTFILGWLKQSSLYGCTMHVFGYKVGVYTLDASGLTMKDTQPTLTSRDNCHPQWNYEKPVPLKIFSYQPRLGQTKYGLVLILRRPDGADEIYQRETGKSLLDK